MIKKFITALMLGFNSGIAFALMSQTTTAYFKNIGVDLALIGLLTLRMMPYSLKYIWAPIIDGVSIDLYPKNFGQRKSWLLTTQCILFLLLISLSYIDAKTNLLLFLIFLIPAIFIAATHDIALDAYRIELFKKQNEAKGNSYVIIGFRAGFFVSSAIGLFLADIIGWQMVYMLLAFAGLPCMAIVFFSEDKFVLNIQKRRNIVLWLRDQIVEPLKILLKMENLLIVLMIISFYKMSDGYLDAMLITFLLDIGFSNTEISIYYSTVGNISYISGTIIAAYIIPKVNIFRFMLVAELLAASTNLLFLILVSRGAVPEFLILINLCENFCSGICNIMLITYMSGLCHHKFNATHYAILFSISSATRVITSSSSGFVAKIFGWDSFFIVSALLSVPSLICLAYLISKKKEYIESFYAMPNRDLN